MVTDQTDFDHEKLQMDFQMENIARAMEEQTTDRLLDAATELYRTESPVDAVITAMHELDSEGFRLENDKREVQLTGFAGVEFYNDLRDSSKYWRDGSEDVNTVEIHGVVIRISKTLPDDALLLVHDKSLAADLTGRGMVPFLIRHENGIVVSRAADQL